MSKKRKSIPGISVANFIKNESAGGIVLFFAVLIAMLWANSPWHHTYHWVWDQQFTISFGGFELRNNLHHWINDGLMAIFFFVVGLELKREITVGQLSSVKQSILPITAAAAGMLTPALIYLFFNGKAPESNGWGIPTATDIAFALGVLSLAGDRVPLSIKVFLTALAVVDDLGAVIVIALFYTSKISMFNLSLGALFLAILILGNYLKIRNTYFYAVFGIGGLWTAFLLSGVHSTIAGVLAAFTIPMKTNLDEIAFTSQMRKLIDKFEKDDNNNLYLLSNQQVKILDNINELTLEASSPLQKLEHNLHSIVAFVIMPIFALANAGVHIDFAHVPELIFAPISLGVICGLFLGKFIGIFSICWLMVRLKLAKLPAKANWGHLAGVSMLAGIGFTMSMFIAELAFKNSPVYIEEAKIGIMLASVLAGITGMLILKLQKPVKDLEENYEVE